MVKNRIRDSIGDRIFNTVNIALMALFLLIMLYPLYFTVIVSVSDIEEVGLGHVYLLPKGLTLEAYRNVFINHDIWIGYMNSIVYAFFGTLYGLAVMLPVSYGLSKKELLGRNITTVFFLITMYFSGGMIPSYLLTKRLGLMNTRLVMIVGPVSVYNMVVTRTYFMSSIPGDIYEAAYIDGASEWRSFFKIALPLAVPVISVMALYFAVGIWNSYFNAMLYINKKTMFPLQLVLRNILILNQEMLTNPDFFSALSGDQQAAVMAKARLAESMKYALIFISSAPLLAAYPFVQKYFVRGLMIGSLKG